MKLSRAFVWTAAAAASVALVRLTLAPSATEAAVAAEPRAAPMAASPREVTSDTPHPEARPARAPSLAPPEHVPAVRTRAARDADATTLYTFDLAVFDGDDQPLPGATVFLAPADGLCNAIGWTDARGHLRVQWRSPRASLRIAYGCEHPAHGASNVKLAELTATPFNAAIQLRGSADTRVAALDELAPGFVPRASVVLPAVEPERVSPWRDLRASEARFDAEGLLQFTEPLDTVPGERLTAPAGWTLPPAPPEPQHAPAPGDDVTLVRGIVTDSGSAAQPFARVRATTLDSAFSASTRTRADGSFGLGPLPARGTRVSFGGGDLGRAFVELGRSDERVQVLRPALQRGRELAVQLVDREGRALAGWKVELASPGAPIAWADSAWTDADGRLRVPNVPASMLRLDAFAPGAEDTLPAASVRALWAGAERELTLDTRVAERAALALRVVDATGRPVDDAEVRLTPENGDRATLVAFDPAHGDRRATALPAGKYRLSIRRAGERAFEWPGTLALDDASELELGPVAFERKGRLALEPSSAELVTYDLARSEPAGDVWLASFRARGRWLLELPAGRYALVATSGTLRRATVFEIAAGRVRAVALDLR